MNKKICFIVTVSMTVDQFLRFSFQKFHENGYDIYVIADMTPEYIETLPEYVKALPIEMKRFLTIQNSCEMIENQDQIAKVKLRRAQGECLVTESR